MTRYHFSYDDPVEIRPGDRIRTTCVYDSSMQSQHTFYGKNPVGEMCYGILTVYPKENILFQACTTWKSLSVCDFPPRHSPCWQLIHNSSSQQSQEFDSQVKPISRLILSMDLQIYLQMTRPMIIKFYSNLK